MDAIVYVSQSGFTKQYAELLGQKTGLPVYSAQQAKKECSSNSAVVYMGWLMAGQIKGLKKARTLYDVRAVCAVGMSFPGMETPESLAAQNNTGTIPLFYLHGGFDLQKLHGIYRFMMSTMKKMLMKTLEKKKDATAQDTEMINMMNNGANYVSAGNLEPVVACITGGCN